MKDKIKITYLISTLLKSGPVNVLYNLVKYIDKNKFDITIVTLSPEFNEHSRIQDFVNLGIEIKSLNLSRLEGYLFGGFKLQKIMNKITPDIIHTHCFRSNLFSALFLRKYKKCSTVHNDYKLDFTALYGKYIGTILFWLNHISLIIIKNNICCSEMLAEILNKKYGYMKFLSVNNGIDTEIFKPAENKKKVREKLNLPQDRTVFIWVGSFIRRKNPLFLADYIKENKDENYYVFCGDGPLLKECRRLIEKQDNVMFTGRIDNVLSYLQGSDYYISTSLSEGLPMSVLEAMACGLNCILSDIKQHKLIESKSNSAITLYKQNDIESLKNCIKAKIKTNLPKNIVSVLNKEFEARNMCENYAKYYGLLAEGKLLPNEI